MKPIHLVRILSGIGNVKSDSLLQTKSQKLFLKKLKNFHKVCIDYIKKKH